MASLPCVVRRLLRTAVLATAMLLATTTVSFPAWPQAPLGGCNVEWASPCAGVSAAVALIVSIVLIALSSVCGRWLMHRRRLRIGKPVTFAAAKAAIADGRHGEAARLVAPLVEAKDRDAEQLVEEIRSISIRRILLDNELRRKAYGAALPIALTLARTGQADCQNIVGRLLFREFDQRQQGLRWVFLSSSRGNEEAADFLADVLPPITDAERADMWAFATAWAPEGEVQTGIVSTEDQR